MSAKGINTSLAVLLSLAALTAASAQSFDLSWYTVDGGGATFSTGGDFELGGTIGQPDAGAMSGGDFRLVGGFWAVAVPTCGCLSDVNNDGSRDGLDVQGFVDCLMAVGTNCVCADVDGLEGLDFNDVSVFVDDLIIGATCP